MSKGDTYLNMSGDDLRAARVLTLAVKFFGTTKAIPSSTIAAELYPRLEEGSFMRQFLRDRELLASLGIVIREVESGDGKVAWQVDDRSSYVQDAGLSDRDARMLYTLCYNMAFDQSFPYRDELRIALAKISQMYRGNTFALSDATSSMEHKTLAKLISCMGEHHAVAVTYTDAQGSTSERTLALMGSFGMRNHSYFVASRVDKAGSLVPDTFRTYRLDRFVKVRELPKISYQIPQDFSIDDYKRLPFQIGNAIGTARLLVGSSPTTEVQHALSLQGTLHEHDNQQVWEVPYSSPDALVAWALAYELEPLSPQELSEAWLAARTRAATYDAYDPSLQTVSLEAQERTRNYAGRKGSASTVRQLIALAASLTDEGTVVTANNIASSLGITYDEARHLIALISLGSGESIDYLPVIMSDDDGEVALMEGAALSARRIRLTRLETTALLEALARLGFEPDDQLVKTLTDGYANPSLTSDEVQSRLDDVHASTNTEMLMQCSHAIIDGACLTFSYQPVGGGKASRRRVIPQFVRHDEGFWYLEAYDLVRRGRRVFRLDGMSNLEQLKLQQPVHMPKGPSEHASSVIVRFKDPRYLDLFYWEGMQIVGQDNAGTLVQIPVYGGTWLARHLATCGESVQVSDQALAAQMQTCLTQG